MALPQKRGRRRPAMTTTVGKRQQRRHVGTLRRDPRDDEAIDELLAALLDPLHEPPDRRMEPEQRPRHFLHHDPRPVAPLATCNSSWHATVRCASGSMAKKRSGSRTTGCRRPKPAGCAISQEIRTSARGATSDLIASRSGVRTAARLRCRSCRSRTAPAHSQPSRASAPAHSSHHTTLPSRRTKRPEPELPRRSPPTPRRNVTAEPERLRTDNRRQREREAGEGDTAPIREAKSRIRHAANRLCDGRHARSSRAAAR